jgi:hypothetical protein
MSASASRTALDGVTTVGGASVVGKAVGAEGGPVAGRVLPTRAELVTVLPWPGLRRGSTVTVHGSVSLLFALLSEATSNGSWAAVVGLPDLGVVAAAEAGVDVSRLALVPRPGSDPVGVIAALLDGMDMVAVGGTERVLDSDARRLSARARHRGSVLLPLGTWPGAEVQLRLVQARWHGLGAGHGLLREREVTIRAGGRGPAARPRSCRLLLPSRTSAVTELTDDPARPVLRSVAG